MTYFSKASLALGLITSLMAPFISSAQLSVTPSGSAASLAAALAGPGVTIVSDTLICNNSANGTFTSVATPIGLPNGILLSTGRASAASGAETGLTSSGFGGAGDADLRALLGTATTSYDACALILHVVPAGDTLKFRYQFGSEEYIQSTCGNFNDAFAFYISGPGITSSLPGVNMALVPGTNIPVAVNSINSGTPGSRGNIANCTAMGSGSPFTSYYIDNTGGSSLSYRGYTTVLTAIHEVNPCDTYRLKMVITDANNDIYDSGVFIEGGSLSSNTYSFSRVDALGNTINGIPHAIVRGCTPATVKILAGHTVTSATTVHYTESGSATSGRDFARLADSVIIPAGAAEATFNVTALTASTGIKTLTLRLVPQFSCGLPDSITLTILDSPSAAILTPDTAICGSDGVLIRTTSSTGVAFSWSPAAGLDNAGIAQPTASPTSPVTYIMSATLPGSGCAPIIDSIHIGKDNHSAYILTPDTSICPGNIVQIRVAAGDSTVFSWTPSLGL
ncbi:MAG: hypothetical protein EBZ77_06940, partial [Chitinophagia bacterium]|nr:hypothetical protein [Chitinophagia bacterium]